MAEIRVPTLGESVSEATIGRWFKKPGDVVKADEPLVELETDKVTLEVNAPSAGVLAEITAKDGETVSPGALLGQITAGGAGAAAAPPPAAAASLPAAGAAFGSVSPAPATVCLPAANPFLTAAPRPATPPATAPTPLASVPTPRPTALPILLANGPSSNL